MPATYTVSIAQLRAWDACFIDARVAGLRDHLGCEVGEDEPIPLTTWSAVAWDEDGVRQSETSVRDLVWALAHTGPSGRRIVVAWAADCAERVLPVWEARRPSDSRPRDAIALVRRWLADPATVTQRELFAAADAGYAAAYAAADDAAGAAAYAADAADAGYAAADAAAYAAAYDADDAYAAAAYAAARKAAIASVRDAINASAVELIRRMCEERPEPLEVE